MVTSTTAAPTRRTHASRPIIKDAYHDASNRDGDVPEAGRRLGAGEGGCVAKNAEDKHVDGRGFLECMASVGTGAVWTMSSGVLKGTPLGQTGSMPMTHAGVVSAPLIVG